MTPQDHARAVADRAAGAGLPTLAEGLSLLYSDMNRIESAIVTWLSAYDAALDEAPPVDPLLTIKSVAETLACSETSIRELIATGRLPAVNLGERLVRIRSRDVQALIEGKEVPM